MEQLDPLESFKLGISLLRAERPHEALPHLERATVAPELALSKAAVLYARALVAGHKTLDVTHKGRTLKFLLRAGNLGLDIHHARGAFFEAQELDYCAQVVPNRSVIVDVGANTGNHTIYFAAFLQPRLLIPIEPVPAAVSSLRMNLRLNDLEVDERGLGVAAGSVEGFVSLNTDSKSDLVVSKTSTASDDKKASIRCVRLDELVPERVDFLKIDVEGFESEVLAGAERILKHDKPLLMIEADDGARDALVSGLEKYGYRRNRAYQADNYQNVFMSVR